MNCYLLIDPDSRSSLIIDAPAGMARIQDYIRQHQLTPRGIVITHGHYDHIQGLGEIDVPFYLHRKDEQFLCDPHLNISSFLGGPCVVEKKPLLVDEGTFTVDSFTMEIIHTPGHTPGSISIKIGTWLFCGDALFLNSIGRTDIPLADEKTLISAIKKMILPLDDRTAVYPGHGPSTTVKHERENNPFLL